jgi:hypothetical protein
MYLRAAMRQAKNSPTSSKTRDGARLSVHWTPNSTDSASHNPSDNSSTRSVSGAGPHTPLSQIRGFPEIPIVSPLPLATTGHMHTPHPTRSGMTADMSAGRPASDWGDLGSGMGMGMGIGMQVTAPDTMFMGDGFNGTETLALPQVGHSARRQNFY